YVGWRWHVWQSQSSQRAQDDRHRRAAQSAADRFADYIAERDGFAAACPGIPVPTPHWGQETAVVLREQYGYDVIRGPQPAEGPWPAGTPMPGQVPPSPTPPPSEADLLR